MKPFYKIAGLILLFFLFLPVTAASPEKNENPEQIWQEFMDLKPENYELLILVRHSDKPFNFWALYELGKRNEELSQKERLFIIDEISGKEWESLLRIEHLYWWLDQYEKRATGSNDLLKLLATFSTESFYRSSLEEHLDKIAYSIKSCDLTAKEVVKKLTSSIITTRTREAVTRCFLEQSQSKSDLIDFANEVSNIDYYNSYYSEALGNWYYSRNKIITELLQRHGYNLENEERLLILKKGRYYLDFENKEKILNDILANNPEYDLILRLRDEIDGQGNDDYLIYLEIINQILFANDKNTLIRKNLMKQMAKWLDPWKLPIFQ